MELAADKLYELLNDKVSVVGHSVQSGEVIDKKDSKYRFFSPQSGEHTEDKPTYKKRGKDRNILTYCPNDDATKCR